MTKIIPQNTIEKNKPPRTPFKGQGEDILIKNLPKSLTPAKLFIKSQENLSNTRFIQDTATNWLPKAVFARSLADFGDMSFLEFVEDFIFYFSAPLLGQEVLRKIYPKLAPEKLRKDIDELIPKSATELFSNKSEAGKRVIPIKAGMILACAAIPAAEYGLSFAKNLFTLKVFKKSDFNSIANLEQNEENTQQQENLKKHSKKYLIRSGIVAAGGLGIGTIFATVGHKSAAIQKISKAILTPYESIIKLFNNFKRKPLSAKQKEYIKGLVNLDFGTKEIEIENSITKEKEKVTKLKLGQGMLGLTAISGFFGYKKAAEDRGKLDVYEVCTRVPIVVLYTIFGSSLFDHAFKSILHNKGKYQDLIKKDSNKEFDTVPNFKELPELAKKIACERKTNPQVEFNRLIKEKAIITAIPYGFSLLFVGFLLAGITRFWTQYRYNHGIGKNQLSKPESSSDKTKQAEGNQKTLNISERTKKLEPSGFSWMN